MASNTESRSPTKVIRSRLPMKYPSCYKEPEMKLAILAGKSAEAVQLVRSVDTSLVPKLSEQGTSGVYFLSNSVGETVAVFKPWDEEANGVNNPHKDIAGDIPDGMTSGHGFLNEFCAYALDANGPTKACNKNQPLVPCTCIASLTLPGSHTVKLGSLQRFVQGDDVGDYGSSVMPLEDLQRIMLLDLRILNCDRHFSNLLFNPKEKRLTPIDHAFSFPSAFTQLGMVSFDWMLWPQAKQPILPELLEEIESIDLDSDLEILGQYNMPKESQLSVWMATTLLQLGAKHGLSFYEMGRMVQRQGDRTAPSCLENILICVLAEIKPPSGEVHSELDSNSQPSSVSGPSSPVQTDSTDPSSCEETLSHETMVSTGELFASTFMEIVEEEIEHILFLLRDEE